MRCYAAVLLIMFSLCVYSAFVDNIRSGRMIKDMVRCEQLTTVLLYYVMFLLSINP
jgi:uncharacterized membrane protein YqhA